MTVSVFEADFTRRVAPPHPFGLHSPRLRLRVRGRRRAQADYTGVLGKNVRSAHMGGYTNLIVGIPES